MFAVSILPSRQRWKRFFTEEVACQPAQGTRGCVSEVEKNAKSW
jgi:hypothetical protein